MLRHYCIIIYMDNVLRMKLPDNLDEIKTYFVISDLHSFHLHIPTFKILQIHAKKFQRPSVIINGDLFDLVFMMRKNPNFKKWIKRSDGMEDFFVPEFDRECAAVNEILDVLQDTFSEVIWIQGNHDGLRIEEFIREVPMQYRGNFSYESKLKIKERGVLDIGYGVWLDIGDISLIHGLYHNVNCHKTHHEDCGKSLIFGHIHKAKMMPFKHRGKTHHVWSLPCMSTLSPEYIRKRTNDWDNGYGILNVKGSGEFSFNTFIAWENKLILADGSSINVGS